MEKGHIGPPPVEQHIDRRDARGVRRKASGHTQGCWKSVRGRPGKLSRIGQNRAVELGMKGMKWKKLQVSD